KHLNVEELDTEVKRYLKSLKPEDPENTSEALEKGEAIDGEVESTKPQDVHFNFVDFQDYMAVINALDVMKRMEPTLSNSQSIANICRDFLGTNLPGEDRIQSIVEYLIKYEAQFGLRLVVIKPDTDEILHGYDYLAEIAQKNRE
ncbi:MAG: hypothetical protein IPN68_18370, partial [Bacteroidetes bacterium]|nr:hypothetical protein [Bacteroidota bacterium]